MKFYFIPEAENLDKALALSETYDMCWEINDFMKPSVYKNAEETERRIRLYRGAGRDLSCDTMHGAFLGVDIAAEDPVFRERSRFLCRQSVEIAAELSLKGVVFHTGLIGTLRLPEYIGNWLDEAQEFYGALCREYPQLTVYLENSFEQEPDVFVTLMERMKPCGNFRLCLDYAHAVLTGTPIEKWMDAFAPYIGHMHLNDNDLKDDLHRAVGDGKIDFDKWYRLIKQIGYDGSVLLEMNGYDRAEKSFNYLSEKYSGGNRT